MQSLPTTVAIETTLACDLKCPECAIGGGMISRAKGFMTFEQYKIIADKIRPFAKLVYLHIWGEPMLNRDIFKMIRYTAPFARTNISTNGMCMTPEMAEQLILAGVDEIIVSIDGVTQDVYEQYRVGGDVKKALNALTMLDHFNRQHGNKATISPQFIVFKHNQHQMELFEKICTTLGLTPFFKPPYIRTSNSRFQLADDPHFVRQHFSDVPSLRNAMSKCKSPSDVINILVDGSVVVCCHDFAGASSFGNIFTQDIQDIWNNSRIQEFRHALASGNAPDFCINNCMTWFLDSGVAKSSTSEKAAKAEELFNLKRGSDMVNLVGKRKKFSIALTSLQSDIDIVRQYFENVNTLKAIDIYEQLADAYPAESTSILTELYDKYQQLTSRDRYSLYQSRHFNFGILPGDKVLDIGSGHLPFPMATHLADVTLENHLHGRAGVPFKHIDGKPVYECSVEEMPFADKEFDFVYCSHVLEHVEDPEKACKELMRVAKRGFIETPTKGKDIFLNSTKVSNHTRHVQLIGSTLVFVDYTDEEINGFSSDILASMLNNPQNDREKAFAALLFLKADILNTMLLWEDHFDYEVRSSTSPVSNTSPNKAVVCPSILEPVQSEPATEQVEELTFMQLASFYPTYLEGFYNTNKMLESANFDQQISSLVAGAFGAIHIIAPYLGKLGYQSNLFIANDYISQFRWMQERKLSVLDGNYWVYEIARWQVETIKPKVLYLLDPITFDSRFIRSLSWRPELIIGYRAANIPNTSDWSEFDIILSPLASLRKAALSLGAKDSQSYIPGFPSWLADMVGNPAPSVDVAFSGSWTTQQHQRRNHYLQTIAAASAHRFSCDLFLNGDPAEFPPEVAQCNRGALFGLPMYRALRSGKIMFDARGSIEIADPVTGKLIDLAGDETANMRLFEATGCGAFLLAEEHSNLKSIFEPGREIETFRDEKDLLDKIGYYLSHPAEREDIARNGQQRCLRDYSMENRSVEFDRIIRSTLGKHAGLSPTF